MTLTLSLGLPVLLLHLCLACYSYGHLLLRKENLRSALAWLMIVFGLPFFGSLIYWVFGINRISRRARKLMASRNAEVTQENDTPPDAIDIQWQQHAAAMATLSGRALTISKGIEHFHTGDLAYPAMLEAINQAENTLYVGFYNFDGSGESQKFIDAIGSAKQRGVEVKVVLDGLGLFASQGDALGALEKVGVGCLLFNPPRFFPPKFHINLRNHRKLLIIDNALAFTGGMNIVNGNVSTQACAASIDECFLVRGPIVCQLSATFLADWVFSGGAIESATPPPARSEWEGVMCRAIEDGPDKAEHVALMALVSACTLSKQKICLVSPYFIPPEPLVTAIQLAALRGVEIWIILPEKPDHKLMGWACEHALGRLLRPGIQVFQVPPPFMHTKLYLFDNNYCLFGSSNLDARSLKLNFEMLVEVYDSAFADAMAEHINTLVKTSAPLTLDQLRGKPVWVRLRAAITTLFSPYL